MVKALSFKASRLDKGEWRRFKELSNPQKIQDFLNALPFNFEQEGETHLSARYALKRGRVHCFEGALLAAAALWIHGRPPLLLDLVTIRPDLDHVVALFEENGYWGAISKTNHAVLRYREPVYRDVRELAMSYFHEYFLSNGKKTLRSFSEPFDLSNLSPSWITTKKSLAGLARTLDRSPHTRILSRKQISNLRQADKIERQASDLIEWRK